MFLPSCTVTNTTMLLYYKDFASVRHVWPVQCWISLKVTYSEWALNLELCRHCCRFHPGFVSLHCVDPRVTVCSATRSVALSCGSSCKSNRERKEKCRLKQASLRLMYNLMILIKHVFFFIYFFTVLFT